MSSGELSMSPTSINWLPRRTLLVYLLFVDRLLIVVYAVTQILSFVSLSLNSPMKRELGLL
uniref:Uncharacterized protein n=1 Tax=Brassica campestris TaxID=3711 RepID=A0A3P5Z798_BRACM|nr:unnamed protein product [Brassica rapa]